MNDTFPHMIHVRQNFPHLPPLDIRARLDVEWEKIRPHIESGRRIAVAVGSRGISNLATIVTTVLENLNAAGAEPFIIPAMGSHGGATPEGQIEVLASYGITENAMNVPIRASLDVRQVGATPDGEPVFCSIEALNADGIVLVNRVKPHTDFSGALGSGLVKMSVIGLGKEKGAATMHLAASRLGYERVIRAMARVVLSTAPILCGVAILENQFHDTAKLVVMPREEIESGEDKLFVESCELMPRLPFEEIDLLIVDRIGKNISGAGMDPNVIGRSVHGYSSSLMREDRSSPFIRRIFARDLTPETHGNATGIGLADITTLRLVSAMDLRVTYLNSLTALTPQSAKIPIHFETDREAIAHALTSLSLPAPRVARIVRIVDTLSVANLQVSEALLDEVERHPHLATSGELAALQFDAEGNLA